MHKMGFEPQTIAYQSRVVTRVLKRPRYVSTLTARVRLLQSNGKEFGLSSSPHLPAKLAPAPDVSPQIMNMTSCAFKERLTVIMHVTMLIDSGSTHDFISEKFIKKHGISTKKSSDVSNVTLADGSSRS